MGIVEFHVPVLMTLKTRCHSSLVVKPAELRSWFVTCLQYLRRWVQPWPKSVDFLDAENQQPPYRRIMQHVKDPLVISAKLNSLNKFASSELRCLPHGEETGRQNYCDNWYRLYGAALKSDTSSWGMY
ncbi:hypothetical protein TNCV_4804881 [Trichonephila clavipes]|nr:hypothetical protein TNCV_4804881 [Trichonephila clavipes]